MSRETFRLQDSFGYRLTYVARLNERGFEERIATEGLTRLGWCALCAAEWESLTRPSEIASFIGVDRAAVSRVLKHLEADDLIRRDTDEGDARARRVELTEAGRAALAQATEGALANAADFNNRLSPVERRVLFDLLGRLIAEDRAGGEALKGL